MPRNILVLNEREPRNPLAGGAETHIFEIFRRLAAQGHSVTLLAASFPGCAREETKDPGAHQKSLPSVRAMRIPSTLFASSKRTEESSAVPRRTPPP